MKVAIDTGPEKGNGVSGIGVNTKYLVNSLQKQVKKGKNFQIECFDFSNNAKRLEEDKFDIVHYPYFHPYFLTLSTVKYAKTIVTIHDLIPLVYPKQYPSGFKGKLRFIIQKRRLKNVDAVLTISETSKKDVVRFLNFPAEKVHAIHIAPSPIFKKENERKKLNGIVSKYNLPTKFVLYLGDVYYNKNIPTLVLACKKAKIPLIIVGKQATEIENNLLISLKNIKGPKDWLRYLNNSPHPETSHYKLLKEMFDKEGEVIRLGFVPDEDLVPIMNLATVYCQPSYYEGFGLGVVHAFSCGVPVVAARTQALVEVAGEAALFADPFDPDVMASKISELLENPSLRAQYIRKANERLKKYSWKKTAKKVIGMYRQVLEK
ncbi:glycosyltransferase family 4 protein [Patescibacteria group bacterium]